MAFVTPDSKFLTCVRKALKKFSKEWIPRKPVKQNRQILSITACSRKWSKRASFGNCIAALWLTKRDRLLGPTSKEARRPAHSPFSPLSPLFSWFLCCVLHSIPCRSLEPLLPSQPL